MLKYMKKSVRTYLNLTGRKLKVLSKLQLNFLKTVLSHLKSPIIHANLRNWSKRPLLQWSILIYNSDLLPKKSG